MEVFCVYWRFEDDEDLYSEKPRASSAGGGRRRGAGASFMEDMISKDDRDWLDIASGTTAPKKPAEDERPRSAGSVLDKGTAKTGRLLSNTTLSYR